jgi:energy-converting hydrogenase Eha subunit A
VLVLLIALFLGAYVFPLADRAWVSGVLAAVVVGVLLGIALVLARQIRNRRDAPTRTRLSWAIAALFLADLIAIGYAGTHCTDFFDNVRSIGILASPVIALAGVALARFRPTWLWIGAIIAAPFAGLVVAGVVVFSTENCGRF